MHFEGFLIKGSEDLNYTTGRLYDTLPKLALGNQGKNNQDPNEPEDGINLRGIKESDLLIVCKDDILKDYHDKDIKKVLSADWILSNLLHPNNMFAYVREKCKKGSNFLDVLLDKSKSLFLT